MSEAIYVVEFRSISRGFGALDAMCKRAGLTLLHANPVCIGKYLICAGGDVADMAEAREAAENPADGEPPFASCLLTGTHPAILDYFRKLTAAADTAPAAIGVLETRSAAGGFQSLDRALKSARCELLRVWLGNRLGGKLCWVLGGSTSDIQSAIRAAAEAVPEKELAGSRVIVAPDPLVAGLFIKGGGPNGPA